MLTIKVLGSGCANCKRLEQIAYKVVSEMGIEAEVIKVTEYPDIMAYNVLSMRVFLPALARCFVV